MLKKFLDWLRQSRNFFNILESATFRSQV